MKQLIALLIILGVLYLARQLHLRYEAVKGGESRSSQSGPQEPTPP